MGAAEDKHFSRVRLPRKRKGIALVWVALGGLVLITFMGLMLDTAYVYWVADQYQSAADAAALAAVVKLPSDSSPYTTTVNEAISAAGKNTAAQATVQISSSDVTLGTWDATTTPPTWTANATPPNAVQVKTHGSPSLFFGKMVGVKTFDANRWATAVTGIKGVGAGLILLGPSGTDLSLSGGGTSVQVSNNGAVYVDSSSTSAITTSGGSTVLASNTYIVGNEAASGFVHTGTVTPKAAFAPDPLAWLQTNPPVTSGGLQFSGVKTINSDTTLNQGIYTGGIKVQGGAHVTLNPGVYVLGSSGSGLNSTGFTVSSSTVTGTGVLIYVPYGPIIVSGGSSSLILSAMTSGPYANILFFQGPHASLEPGYTGPDNPAYTNSVLSGGGAMKLTGVMYFPTADPLTVSGGSDMSSTGNQMITYGLKASGGSTFLLTYNPGTAAAIPGLGTSNPHLVK